uniref:Uncharacterized protein n=1 Tax=Avena sativa TaxID=4498 RepID=A0ACD5YDE6_AVESA
MQQPSLRNIGGSRYETQREPEALGAPGFDGPDHWSWELRMKHRLFGFNPLVWGIVETGFSYVDEANPTSLEQMNCHYNTQAMNALYCALSDDQLYRIWHLDSAKEIWDALKIMHEDTGDTPIVRELKVKLLREKMRLFVLRKGESPNDMYWRLQALLNKMKRLGCKEATDSYVVRKILRAMTPRNPTMVSNICEKPNFEELAPQDGDR